MNLKICQKCKNTEKIIFWKGLQKNSALPTIYCSFDKKEKYCEKIFFNNKKMVKEVIGKHPTFISKFMDITENCPYYMEHKLSEWNR